MMDIDNGVRRFIHTGPDWSRPPVYVNVGNYRSMTMCVVWWGYAIGSRFATIPGRLLLIVSGFVVLCVPMAVNAPVRLLALSLSSFLFVDFVLGFIWRPRLRMSRRMPDRVGCGGDVLVEYSLENLSRFTAWNIELDSGLLPEGLELKSDAASVACIPGRGKASVRTFASATRRGRYSISPIMATSAFPFCVFQWTRRQRGSAQSLIVHPLYHGLRSLSLPVGRKFQRHGLTLVSKVGESPDFAGCREFRPGDDPRRIHWPSSARRGNLVVKEYQEEYLPRIAVILDTHLPPKGLKNRILRRPGSLVPELEAAISLTASLADYLARGDYVVDIFAAGPEVYHFQTGRSLGYFENMLDILACLDVSRSETMKELSPVVMEEISDIGCAAVVLLHWSDAVAKFVEGLRDAGTSVRIFMVGGAAAFNGACPDGMRVTPEDILEGRVEHL